LFQGRFRRVVWPSAPAGSAAGGKSEEVAHV
jgi:hypothetical protein